MSYRLTIYCPDQHLIYDGHTPERRGIGGGVTARIRLARALARRGNQVTMICNCPRKGRFDDVRYLPVQDVRRIEADVLILSSSGGALDLRPALDLEIEARLRLVWVHGTTPPGGIHQVPFDYLYTPSNFLRRIVREEWGIPPAKIFVSYNGVERSFFQPTLLDWPRRNPYRLVYTGHPDKGLQAALGVLRMLRTQDPRFELHIYGGDGLYGGKDQPLAQESGVVYHGTVGQRRLCQELKRDNIAINLQARPEPFGITLVESMAAGCIVLASPVGAYPDLVRHGYNGFLISGEHTAHETQAKAASLIVDLVQHPDFADFIRRNAQATPLDSDTLARACEEHWEWALGKAPSVACTDTCPECGGAWLALADGYHCIGCGRYSQIPQAFANDGF